MRRLPRNIAQGLGRAGAHLEVQAVVRGLGDGGQLLARGGGPHEAAPAALGHALVARRNQARPHLQSNGMQCSLCGPG